MTVSIPNYAYRYDRKGKPVFVPSGMDDISLSSDSDIELQEAFEKTIAVLKADGFAISGAKLRPPAPAIDLFNCDLSSGRSVVQDERIAKFKAAGTGPTSQHAFEAYCALVGAGNR